MTDSAQPKPQATGFAGLNSLVTDLSEDATQVEVPAAPAPPARAPEKVVDAPKPAYPAGIIWPTPENTAAAGPVVRAVKPAAPAKAPTASASGNFTVAWVIAALVGLGFWAVIDGPGKQGQTPAPASPASPGWSAELPAAPVANPVPAPLEDQQPEIGRNKVLDIPQIRWCKREKMRLNGIDIVVDRNVPIEVAVFNSRIDDYNSRCAEFRYRRGAVEQVERELAAEQQTLSGRAMTEWIQTWHADAGRQGNAASVATLPISADTAADGAVRAATPTTGPTPAEISAEEQAAIDVACSDQRLLHGDAAFQLCVAGKRASLAASPRNIDLSELDEAELASIKNACSDQRLTEGPAAYNACLLRHLAALKTAPRHIDTSDLSAAELQSLESACSTAKLLEGPASYNRCRARKLKALRAGQRNVDLSGLIDGRRGLIETTAGNYSIRPALLHTTDA